MSFRSAICLPLLLVAHHVDAQEISYLAEPKRFQTALEQLVTAVGVRAETLQIVVDTDEILLVARTDRDAPLTRWMVRDVKFLGLHVNKLEEPLVLNPDRDIPVEAFFPLSDIPIANLPVIVDRAATRAGLDRPGRDGRVLISRGEPKTAGMGTGPVGWTIRVGERDNIATAWASADGTVIGADITGTTHWRARSLLTQTYWPMAQAQSAFAAALGSAPAIRSIVFSRTEVTLTFGADVGARAWVWDGGNDAEPLREAAATPPTAAGAFSLDAVDLTRFERVKDAAMQAAGPEAMTIDAVRILPEPEAAVGARPRWEVDVLTPYKGTGFPRAVVVTVLLDAEGAVTGILSAEDLRAAADRTKPDALLKTIAAYREALGAQAQFYEIIVWPERAMIRQPHPTRKGMTLTTSLDEDGIGGETEFPVMMQTEDDIFTLADLAPLDAGVIEVIRTQAVAAIGIGGTEVYRMTLSSGAPFWSDRRGWPLLDVRVGSPPDFRDGGYVVFTLDGELVEAVQ